jgi:Fe-S-cluster-containing dehydrogenase component
LLCIACSYCSAVTPYGWRRIVDAQDDGKRYIFESDELLSAFLELEATLL